MKALLEMMNQPLIHRLGWGLLHSLWQGALIGVVFGALRFALRRRSANLRYMIGCLGLAVLLIAPVVTVFVGSIPSPQAGHAVSASAPASVVPIFSSSEGVGSNVGNGAGSFLQTATDFFGRLAPSLAAVWLAGVVLFSLRLTRSCWWVRTIRLRDNELVEPEWIERLNDLRRRFGISRPVRLLKSALVEVPTVIGWLRPVILLPAACLTGLTPGQLEAILAHELAHVRRFDYLVNAFQCLVETLMFYHPVVWWISRCVREERENCCDDLVIRICGDRLAYARALATLEESRAGLPRLAFAASGGSLLNRIRRLLGVSNDNQPASARQLGGLALLGIGLVLILMGACLMLVPATYQATARIRVDRDVPETGGTIVEATANYDSYFIPTEVQVIQSRIVLSRVVQALQLTHDWGKRRNGGAELTTSEAVDFLKKRISVQPVRDALLIEIQASGGTPEEAAKLADGVAEAYKEYRFDLLTQKSDRGIKVLQKQYNGQEEKVHQQQTNVDYLREKLRIPDSLANHNDPGSVYSPEILKQLMAQRRQEQSKYNDRLTRWEKLKDISHKELEKALPLAVTDEELNILVAELNEAQLKLIEIGNQFKPDDPLYQTQDKLVKALEQKVNDRIDGVFLGIKADLDSQKAKLDDLVAQVEQGQATNIEQATKWAPYFEAERKREDLQILSKALQNRIFQEQTELALPKTSMVQIVDRAEPPLQAIAPNRPFATVLIGLGALLDAAGLLMLKAKRVADATLP